MLVTTEIDSASGPMDGHKLVYTLKSKDGSKVVEQATLDVGERLDWKFDNGEVMGWYPRNYGAQVLYELETALIDKVSSTPLLNELGHALTSHQSGTAVATKIQRVGFRHAVLVEEPLVDQPGTTFLFEVNGIRIFCGGSNWIPADNFLTQIEPGRYKRWVELMVSCMDGIIRLTFLRCKGIRTC